MAACRTQQQWQQVLQLLALMARSALQADEVCIRLAIHALEEAGRPRDAASLVRHARDAARCPAAVSGGCKPGLPIEFEKVLRSFLKVHVQDLAENHESGL